MREKIKTAGQLRDFLADVMQRVEIGVVDIDKASRITKMAGQINESLYAEVKVARIHADAGAELLKLGTLPIGADVGGE